MKNKRILLILGLIIISLIAMPKKVLAVTDISNGAMSYSSSYISYTGKSIKFPYTINIGGKELVEGEDFTVDYPSDNISLGEKTATITGIGNYTGTREFTYTVQPAYLESTGLIVSDAVYTGKPITTNYKLVMNGITLEEGTDYTVKYTNNISVGVAYIILEGKGNYTGTTGKSFKINPAKVKNFSADIENNKLVLTWKTDDTVDGYILYKSESKNGTYSQLIKIPGNQYDGYEDISAKSGKIYYYKAKTYKNSNGTEYTSDFVGPEGITYVKKTTLSIQSYKDKAKLTWNKIDNATGYEIYRADSKNGTYKKVKSISGNKTFTWTNTGLKKYKQYYYYIKVYTKINGKNVYSNGSNKVEKASLDLAKIKSLKYGSSKNTITWAKISGITGYEVYRATSKNGSYKKITTIKKNSTLKYTDKNLSLGKVYYYKVRAYKNQNGKKIYGQYSAVKSVATGSRKQQMNKLKLVPNQDFKNSSYSSYYKDYEALIKKNTKSSMSNYEKVQTMYKYLVTHMYHKDGWTCKHFAATFVGICDVLGLDAYAVSGQTRSGSGYTAHTWTIVKINGTEYIFDASLERHNSDRNKGKVQYKYFFKTYSELKGVYKVSGHDTFFTFFMVPGSYLK